MTDEGYTVPVAVPRANLRPIPCHRRRSRRSRPIAPCGQKNDPLTKQNRCYSVFVNCARVHFFGTIDRASLSCNTTTLAPQIVGLGFRAQSGRIVRI
jgi:hypothetical protein